MNRIIRENTCDDLNASRHGLLICRHESQDKWMQINDSKVFTSTSQQLIKIINRLFGHYSLIPSWVYSKSTNTTPRCQKEAERNLIFSALCWYFRSNGKSMPVRVSKTGSITYKIRTFFGGERQ